MIARTTTMLLVHAAVTWFLVGLIWVVQVVHYPLFALVGWETFAAYAARHQRLITLVVGGPMILELALAAWLAVRFAGSKQGTARVVAWLGLLLVAGIWASTAFLQVPAHGELAEGFDRVAHDRLVSTNWIRTALWTVRGIVVVPVLLLYAREPASRRRP